MISLLEELSQAENFKSYGFGHLQTALDRARKYMENETFTRRSPLDEETYHQLAYELDLDKVQWIDPVTNLDCLMVRNHMGAWCGYVGVMPDHPWYELSYGSCPRPTCEGGYCEHTPESLISVHGGLTFSSLCAPGEPREGICHVPAPGREDRVWWFGFDCGHAFDLTPSLGGWGDDTYRDFDYVVNQVRLLAVQLAEIEKENG